MTKRAHTGIGALAGAAAAAGLMLAAIHPKTPVTPAPRDPAKVAAGILPRPDLTPGKTLPVSNGDLCKPGYAGRVRNVTSQEKQAIYRAYGIVGHKPGAYEIDHLISLELGGSNDPANLWPESYTGLWNAHEKDRLENVLHRRVCSGEESLADAQAEISGDWTIAYVRYLGQPAETSEKP